MKEMLDFTTASRDELSKVWQAIADEMGDDRFFTTKELDYLPRLLAEREQVLAFSSGLHKGNTWLIVLTGERIILLDKGMIYGLRQSSIELERVNNFDSEKGLMFGRISIGSNAETYEITNVWKKTVDPFTKKLREAVKAKQRHEVLRSPGTGGDDDAPSNNRGDQEEPARDEYENLTEGDYEIYTPPSSQEAGPLALAALEASGPTDEFAPSLQDKYAQTSPSRIRLERAGLL